MRITHRMIANTVNYNLQNSLRSLEKYSNQLSTGKAFQRPSENPVGVGRVMGYSASINRNEQFRLNMNQSQGWLENSEYALQNSLDVMQRIRELAIYGANESLTAEDRRAIAPEVLEFIDHLIGIANTESNGLYIFGGHQTLKAPFVRENVYGIKAHYLETSHSGHAVFDAGEIEAGTAGREIILNITVDGEKYTVKTVSGGADRAATFDNLKNAIESHSRLARHIAVTGDESAMFLSRTAPGDFTIHAATEEAVAVLGNLAEDAPLAEILAADQNINLSGGISPNSFLAGDYKIMTEDTGGAYAVNAGTQFIEYSQSGDPLVNSINAVSAGRNQSVSFVAAEIDGTDVTFSYEYKEMDPGSGAVTMNRGSVTIDKSAAVPQTITVGSVEYEINLNNLEFATGDRMVINTNAEIAEPGEADLVHLYKDEEANLIFTFAFEQDALIDGVHNFVFYSLDRQSGALLNSSVDLEWGGSFGTNTDYDFPAAGFTVGVLGENGSFAERTEKVSAGGLQNGAYQLSHTGLTSDRDYEGSAQVVQQYLQGEAASILSGSAGPGLVSMDIADADKNASILLEVREVNPENGTVKFSYRSHQYDRDGSYQKTEGNITLDFGGDEIQTKAVGGLNINFRGLDNLSPSDAEGLKAGDRGIVNITPSVSAGESYEQFNITGEHRGSDSEARYIFTEGALAGTDTELRYFSLNTFKRSPDHGRIYDGAFKVNDDTLELLRLPQNQVFHYDSSGFPVYYGDNKDRIQEISPHQEVIMNMNGEEAFGPNQEIFEAVYNVYWALMENDRETLGDGALEKMDTAVDQILENLSQVGARSNRVEAMQSTLFSENLYLREVRSNIEDIDLAHVITEFTMQENAYRAALSTASMMMQPSLVDYLR